MTIESPCINVCQLSEDRSVCTGCHRSLSEIANWTRMTSVEKLRANDLAQHRRAIATANARICPMSKEKAAEHLRARKS